jgi:hypothetical protein
MLEKLKRSALSVSEWFKKQLETISFHRFFDFERVKNFVGVNFTEIYSRLVLFVGQNVVTSVGMLIVLLISLLFFFQINNIILNYFDDINTTLKLRLSMFLTGSVAVMSAAIIFSNLSFIEILIGRLIKFKSTLSKDLPISDGNLKIIEDIKIFNYFKYTKIFFGSLIIYVLFTYSADVFGKKLLLCMFLFGIFLAVVKIRRKWIYYFYIPSQIMFVSIIAASFLMPRSIGFEGHRDTSYLKTLVAAEPLKLKLTYSPEIIGIESGRDAVLRKLNTFEFLNRVELDYVDYRDYMELDLTWSIAPLCIFFEYSARLKLNDYWLTGNENLSTATNALHACETPYGAFSEDILTKKLMQSLSAGEIMAKSFELEMLQFFSTFRVGEIWLNEKALQEPPSKIPGYKNVSAEQSEIDTVFLGELSKVIYNSQRGRYMHHYQSAMYPILTGDGWQGYFSNQYGLGALSILKLLDSSSLITSFDAPFYGAMISIIALLLYQIFQMYKKSLFFKLYFALAYSGSILATLALSEFMAPLLYPLRYLPMFVLVIYLSSKAEEKFDVKSSFFIVLTVIAMSIYSIEYGAMAGLSILASGLVLKSIRTILFSIGCLVFLYVFKHLFAIENGSTYSDYLSLDFFSSSILVNLLIVFSFFTSFMCAVMVSKIANKHERFAMIFIAAFLVLASIKLTLNGAFNHAGILIYLNALIWWRLRSYQPRRINKVVFIPIVVNFLIALNVVGLSTAISNFEISPPESSIYLTNKDFSIRPIDSELYDFFDDFDTLYSTGALVVSSTDAALYFHSKKDLTPPMPDFSTSLYLVKNQIKAAKYFKDNKPEKIIIDKSDSAFKLTGRLAALQNVDKVYYERNKKINFIPFSKKQDMIKNLIQNFKINDEKRSFLTRISLEQNYYDCGTSKYFDAYCLK